MWRSIKSVRGVWSNTLHVVIGAAIGMVIVAAPVQADDRWAVIAYSSLTGRWGHSKGESRSEVAQAAALRECGEGAEILVSSKNCWVSLVEGDRTVSGGIGRSEVEATENARRQLGSRGACKVTVYSGKDRYALIGEDWVYWFTERGELHY